MKWPAATPADLLSEKTFLVIREDLHAAEENGSQCDKGDAKPSPQESVGATPCAADTWPKMRKKRPRKMRATAFENSDGEEPRPTTASLEAPLVLDPRLVDKLDMSLLKKESLSESLTRITLGVVQAPPKVAEIARNESQTERSKPRARFALALTENESKTKTSIDSPESDAKRLDDNNNKNKLNSTQQQQQQQQLSPLRSRSSRTVSSSDVALPAGPGSRKLRGSPRLQPPEPCQACGRATQPERLHSHPAKSPSPPATLAARERASPTLLRGSARSSPSVIPVRAAGRGPAPRKQPSARLEQLHHRIPGTVGPGSPKQPSSPVAMASPRSRREPLGSNKTLRLEDKPARIEENTSVDDELKKERKENSAERPTSTEEKSAGSTGKRRPRSVTCYICGREFGTASFPIHEPKCLQKWERENKSLPNAQRRQQPVRPTVPIDSEEWNAAAWEQSQALLIPCPKCKRTFLPDRLIVHERNCRIQKGRGGAPTSRSLPKSTSTIGSLGTDSSWSPRRAYLPATGPRTSRIGTGHPYARKLSRIAVRHRSAHDQRRSQ